MSDLLNQASLVLIPSGYKEDVVYSEIPTDGSGDLTFTRASDGTRINSAGLVENCPWNLFTNSENGSSSNWGNVYNISSVTLNSTTAPNGTNTGNLVVENSVNSTHWFEQSFTAIAGTSYTISAYFKAKERTQCTFYGFADNGVFASQIVIFNLSTGVVVTQSGTQTNSIENVGNGWYRCSMTLIANASATAYFGYGLANGGTNSYQGDGTSGLYMWGRQLNTGALKPYFPTTNRQDVPRLTYQNGGGGCPSLLLEKQSTNLALYSEQFDNAAWSNVNLNETANDTISPDGTQNADKLTEDSSNGIHSIYTTNPITTTSTQAYTTSIFYKKGTRRYFAIKMQIGTDSYTQVFDADGVTTGSNSSNGLTSVSTSIVSMGNGWVRATLTGTSGQTGAYIILSLSDSASPSFDPTNFNPTYQGTGTDYGYFWGAQLEASSYATSYISTQGSSVTRLADACYKTGISSLIGQTQGTLFFDAQRLYLSGDRSVCVIYTNGSSYIQVYLINDIRVIINGTVIMTGQTIAENTRYKIAIAYKSGDHAMYVNGVQIATTTSSIAPTVLNDLYIGNAFGTEQSGVYDQAILFPTRLTNTQLASLTTL